MTEFFAENYPLKFEQFNYDDLVNKVNLLENNLNLNKLGDDNRNYINVLLDKEKILRSFSKFVDENPKVSVLISAQQFEISRKVIEIMLDQTYKI